MEEIYKKVGDDIMDISGVVSFGCCGYKNTMTDEKKKKICDLVGKDYSVEFEITDSIPTYH